MAVRKRNIYSYDLVKSFKLSRSKVDLYLSCQHGFFIDRKLGVGHPQGFPYS
tara:strand:+ start:1190 stop:1345 length:156 start_codon:yes stop_codon:yes gene_type:complete